MKDQEDAALESGWQCGVTLKRTRDGASWTIAVPADGQDHSANLQRAKEQALALWDELESAFDTEPRARAKSR